MKEFLESSLFHIEVVLFIILWAYMAIYVYDQIKHKRK